MTYCTRANSRLALLAPLLVYITMTGGTGDTFASTVTKLPPDQAKKQIEWSLRYSDLVVQGRVRFLMRSTERLSALYPGLESGSEARAVVTLISINVERAIKGLCEQDLMILVPSLHGIPPCEPGETIIVAANYNPLIDRFVLRNYDGFFVEHGNVLQNKSKYSATDLQFDRSQIDEIVRSADLQPVFSRADHVGVGEALTVDVREEFGVSITTIEFRVQKTLSGSPLPGQVTVTSKETLKPRSAPTPTIQAGEVWYFALKKIDGRLEPVDGPNSLFKLENGELKYNGRAPYARDARSFERLVIESSRQQ